MIDLDQLDLRTLQKECARAVATMEATNNNIYKFNMFSNKILYKTLRH